MRVYLDDVRTPIEKDWVVVRSYNEFVEKILEIGLENIFTISLDHDLGPSSMKEYFENVSPNYTLNYDKIEEKTGYDCAKWLVNHFYDKNPDRLDNSRLLKREKIKFPTIYTHSANPIGSANIMGYINNFFMNENQEQDCARVKIPHTV